MRYSKGKIVLSIVNAIKQSINNKNQSQQLAFNLNEKNHEIFITFVTNSLISKYIPLSNLLNSLLERSRVQILKTWPSYTERMKCLSFNCNEQDFLLNDFVKSLKNRYLMELNYQISKKNSIDLMRLSSLRKDEKIINHEQSVYEEQISKEIRNEYEEKLNEIKKEQQEVLNQFPIIINISIDLTM